MGWGGGGWRLKKVGGKIARELGRGETEMTLLEILEKIR
jgi:hypothetical protein